MAASSELKHEWRRFKLDPPGARFEKHRRRMQRRPKWLAAVRASLGIALLGAGIVFMFLPGPGLLGIVFGLALLAGMSRRLAVGMDRAEPPVRRGVIRAQAWWRARSRPIKALLLALGTVFVALAGYAAWQRFVA